MWHFGFQNKKAPTKREKIIRNEKHTSVASTLCFPIMEMTVKLIACACQFNISIVSFRCWCQIGFVFIVVVIVVGFCYIFWISINSTRGKTSKTRAVNEKNIFMIVKPIKLQHLIFTQKIILRMDFIAFYIHMHREKELESHSIHLAT